ncbi:hypothetical protein CPC08DRAFT_709732 [Agrocybe pediades]|nr:hypothetical protein CPC08DRAFT_709732 [Agrocybe pediades]
MSQSNPPHVTPLVNLSQSIITGGTYTQHNNIDQRRYYSHDRDSGYASVFLDNVATTAMHNSRRAIEPPLKCHANTRVAVKKRIIDWTKGNVDEETNRKPIVWLKGAAGAGKSAIAKDTAEQCDKEGLLLGSFFFRTTDPSRNHVGRLGATLAYQVCRILPEVRSTVSTLVEEDPLIFESSNFSKQLTTLIINPLSNIILAKDQSGPTLIPRLIIIDGLDECTESINSQKELLLSLFKATCSMPYIQFLVCSRPESHINTTFGRPEMASILYEISLDNDDSAPADIRLYFEDKFKEIKHEHAFKDSLPDTWPTPQMIDDLVNKSSGQFIYASTVVGYIESAKHRPNERLEAIFNLRPAFKDQPFTQLDILYRHIISKAEDLPKVLDILAFPALYEHFPAKSIEVMLQLKQGDVKVMLVDLLSIVAFTADMEVRLLHKSLIDFLSDPQRAGDLYQNFPAVHLKHVVRSISIFSAACHGLESPEYPLPLTEPLHLLGIQLHHWKTNDDHPLDAVHFISDAYLRAARDFPLSEFLKGLLLIRDGRGPASDHVDLEFLRTYITYLHNTKHMCDEAMLLYERRIRQYCEFVLSVLENNLSNSLKAHLFYACYQFFPAVQRQNHVPPLELFKAFKFTSFVPIPNNFPGAENFGHTIASVMTNASDFSVGDDIRRISSELTKGIKREEIFAKSARFCLASLCDERSTRSAARCMSRIMGINERKRRERPWRWRQLNPRRFLSHGLGICIRKPYGHHDAVPVRRSKKGSWPNRQLQSSDAIFTIREYICFGRHSNLLKEKARKRGRKQGGLPEYIFLLYLLPYALPFSGRYEPLVTMCRKKSFASISRFWPKESRRARQAIETYLRRVESQENMAPVRSRYKGWHNTTNVLIVSFSVLLLFLSTFTAISFGSRGLDLVYLSFAYRRGPAACLHEITTVSSR